MKMNFLLASIGCLLMLANCSSDPMMPQNLDAASPAGQPYPAGVTLRKEAGVWTYREFPSGRRLYVFDGDQAGVSNCNQGCVAAWPPLLARANAGIVGDWSVIIREDGRRQWAYKGQPAYRFVHDTRARPIGNAQDGRWHLLVP